MMINHKQEAYLPFYRGSNTHSSWRTSYLDGLGSSLVRSIRIDVHRMLMVSRIEAHNWPLSKPVGPCGAVMELWAKHLPWGGIIIRPWEYFARDLRETCCVPRSRGSACEPWGLPMLGVPRWFYYVSSYLSAIRLSVNISSCDVIQKICKWWWPRISPSKCDTVLQRL